MSAEKRQCRDCGLPIRWFRTPTGKWTPLTDGTSPHGRWIITGRDTARQLMGVELEAAKAEGELLFDHHAAECPARRSNSGKAPPQEALDKIEILFQKRGNRRGRPA